jgi:hypothetical protein
MWASYPKKCSVGRRSVAVRCPHRASRSKDQKARPLGVDALLVGSGKALDVGAVDGHRRRSLELRWEAGLDEQRRELVQADLARRGNRRAGKYLAGVRIDVELMVVIDQDTVLDDALDGPPAGVHPLVLDLHGLRDPERRSLRGLSFFTIGTRRRWSSCAARRWRGRCMPRGPRQWDESWPSGPPFRGRTQLDGDLAGGDRDGTRDPLLVRHRVGLRGVRSTAEQRSAVQPPPSAHRRTAWANRVGSSGCATNCWSGW